MTTTTDNDRAAFAAWYRKADQVCQDIAGIGIDDLADGPSWDSWADGASPREYAIERLQEEGYPGLEDDIES